MWDGAHILDGLHGWVCLGDRGPPNEKAETRVLVGRTQTPGGGWDRRLDEEGSVTPQALPSGSFPHLFLGGGGGCKGLSPIFGVVAGSYVSTVALGPAG